MLCAKRDRIPYLIRYDRCPDCDGCVDDRCGGCGGRFCGGTYEWWMTSPDQRQPDSPCNRCPEKVSKDITTSDGPRTVDVRCNADTGHTGIHHWDPYRAGREETT